MTKITNNDLYKNKYSIDVLIDNIDQLDLTIIIKTQDITMEFVNNYLLNEKYQITPEEKTIDLNMILLYNQKLAS